MSEENSFDIVDEVSDNESQEQGLSIGESLKAARSKKQLTIKSIAEELKLNPTYIEALEQEKFKDLPAPPYVRVYIKSIAHYLGIDPEPLLLVYAKHEGASFISTDRERRDTIAINVQSEAPQSHKQIFIVILILVLGLMFLLYKNGQPPVVPEHHEPDSVEVMVEMAQDTVGMDVPILEGETINDTTQSSSDATTLESGPWEFSLVVVADSTWIHMFKDGRVVKKGILYKKDTLALHVKDSINIKVGKIQNIRILRNDTVLSTSGINMASYVITRKAIETMTQQSWEKSFGKPIN